MIEAGLLREAGQLPPARATESEGRGRPATRVALDPDKRHVVGLTIRPKRVEGTRLSLTGQPVEETKSAAVRSANVIGQVAGELAETLIDGDTLAVGVSSTGLIDEGDMKLLFSSSAPRSPGLSLGPVLSAVRELPVALENDVHALGDQWRLAYPSAADETVLLIRLGDGEVGASLMPAGGSADRGCVRGANELGHMQVHTGGFTPPRCYCGQSQCLERVFSSATVSRLLGRRRRLSAVLREWTLGDPNRTPKTNADPSAKTSEIIRRLVSVLGTAAANAVNLMRPHRVVWVGAGPIADLLVDLEPSLSEATATRLLPILRQRVRFESWTPALPESPPVPGSAESTSRGRNTFGDGGDAVTAGYLALAVLTGRRAPAAGRLTLRLAASLESSA